MLTPCLLCSATAHACTICGKQTEAGVHRTTLVNGTLMHWWRCGEHIYTEIAPAAAPAPERYTASPTFIANPARAAEVTRVVILHTTTETYYEIEETVDGRFWRAGLRSKLPRNKWKLDKVTP